MDEKTITLTEEELNARIEEAVNSKTKDLIAKHNGEMATSRKRIKELESANMSQEDLEKKVREEQDKALQDELTELRSYKKGKVIEERLAKENLPNHFKYDTRLLNATEQDFDKVVKDVKKEYEATLPKGNQISTVVKTGGTAQPSATPTDAANEAFAQVLGSIVGK